MRGPSAEAAQRVASVATVTNAMRAGDWPTTVEIIGLLGDILEQASHWALVAELQAA